MSLWWGAGGGRVGGAQVNSSGNATLNCIMVMAALAERQKPECLRLAGPRAEITCEHAPWPGEIKGRHGLIGRAAPIRSKRRVVASSLIAEVSSRSVPPSPHNDLKMDRPHFNAIRTMNPVTTKTTTTPQRPGPPS